MGFYVMCCNCLVMGGGFEMSGSVFRILSELL